MSNKLLPICIPSYMLMFNYKMRHLRKKRPAEQEDPSSRNNRTTPTRCQIPLTLHANKPEL